MNSIVSLILSFIAIAPSQSGDSQAKPAACPGATDQRFENEVWAKVAARKCLTCHRKGGDAEKSQFILADPNKAGADAIRKNYAAFVRMAAVKEKSEPRMLLKVVGKL